MQNQGLVRHSDKICAAYAIENMPNNPSEQSEKYIWVTYVGKNLAERPKAAGWAN